jgi:hypothetical protein
MSDGKVTPVIYTGTSHTEREGGFEYTIALSSGNPI